jgi:hypothetical protein
MFIVKMVFSVRENAAFLSAARQALLLLTGVPISGPAPRQQLFLRARTRGQRSNPPTARQTIGAQAAPPALALFLVFGARQW